jgi:hypothetical protein
MSKTLSVFGAALAAIAAALWACGNGSSGGGAAQDAGHDASVDAGSDSHTPDSAGPDSTTSDGATAADGSDGAAAADGGDGGVPADASDEGCLPPVDGGHYVGLQWNETCGQTVTSYDVLWGQVDGGPYPNSADAGDACDAAACAGDAASPQLVCGYDLRGLAPGYWCIVVESCDDAGCSAPSNQSCVTLPPPCP